ANQPVQLVHDFLQPPPADGFLVLLRLVAALAPRAAPVLGTVRARLGRPAGHGGRQPPAVVPRARCRIRPVQRAEPGKSLGGGHPPLAEPSQDFVDAARLVAARRHAAAHPVLVVLGAAPLPGWGGYLSTVCRTPRECAGTRGPTPRPACSEGEGSLFRRRSRRASGAGPPRPRSPRQPGRRGTMRGRATGCACPRGTTSV